MNRDGEGNPDDLKTRTKAFALRIILLYVALWRSAFLLHPSAFILGVRPVACAAACPSLLWPDVI